MIVFDEPKTAPRAIAKPRPEAIRRGILASYGDESFGYLLKADLKYSGTYRYIRLREGFKSHLSGLHGSKSQALEAIFGDSQQDGQVALKNPKTKPWGRRSPPGHRGRELLPRGFPSGQGRYPLREARNLNLRGR